MFSDRTRWALTENPIARAVATRCAAGREYLDLTETNPTRASLPMPEEEVRRALLLPQPLAYAPEPMGLVAAREAVAELYGGRVPASRILLTASTSEAYSFLFKLLCNPGDRLVAPVPGYPLFDYLATLESVALDTYPSHYADGWHLDVAGLARSLTGRTRAIIVVSPNNPTGAVLQRAEREALVALCRERSLALICDEVFADYLFGADAAGAGSLAGEDGCLSFVLGGLSKSCLLPQVKLAWTLVQGPDEIVASALGRLEVVADSFLSVSTSAQIALPAILALRPRIQAPLMARLTANRRTLYRALAGTSATVLAGDGGWSAVLRVPRDCSEQEHVLMLLEREGVLTHPGFFFDFPRDGHLVVSLLVPEEVFAEAASRLARYFAARAGDA